MGDIESTICEMPPEDRAVLARMKLHGPATDDDSPVWSPRWAFPAWSTTGQGSAG
jgi:hypothetical protein